MTIAFTKDASLNIDASASGETAVFEFGAGGAVTVRYTLRDTAGRAYVVRDIDFLTFTSSLTTEERTTLMEELRAAAADSAGFSAV